MVLVDDDENVRAMLVSVLQGLGHSVRPFASGAETLEFMLRAEACDLVITDHEMPVRGGLSLTARLRAIGNCGPILVHSSALTEATRREYLLFNRIGFLDKPAGFPALREALNVLCGGSEDLLTTSR